MAKQQDDSERDAGRFRIDKWLWAARFYKPRGLSAEAIDAGDRSRLTEQVGRLAAALDRAAGILSGTK